VSLAIPYNAPAAPAILRPGGWVMFSKENRRFSLLVIAIVTIVVVTVTAIVILTTTGHPDSTIKVTGFVGGGLALLGFLLREEWGRSEARQDRHKIAHELVEVKQAATTAAEVAATNAEAVAEKIKEAVVTPAPAQVAMPKTPEELDAVMEKVVVKTTRVACREVLDELLEEMLDERLAKAFEEQKRKAEQSERDKAEGI
jgi:hypothetical protein